MKLSEIRTVKKFLEGLDNFDMDNMREVIESMANDEDDFEVDNYRFIDSVAIDSIQVEEMESDAYILGCFNPGFIADNSNLSYEIVKALQDGEQFEALGQHLIDNDCIEDMQQEYSNLDGYGHHFAYYDGETLEINDYYVFRTN